MIESLPAVGGWHVPELAKGVVFDFHALRKLRDVPPSMKTVQIKPVDADTTTFPPLRLQVAADHPARAEGDYVVYWMTASRRVEWNFALQRAADWATAVAAAAGCR